METTCNSMGPSTSSPEYLVQLLKDKRQLQAVPGCFLHLERILDEEITRVRGSVLHLGSDSEPLMLPEPAGTVVTLTEKLMVPVKEHPDFNFVGRLLGPRGMTAKQLELETGCKILVRGKGSMRDKHKEELMRGKAKWEHLNEDLHVLISVEDTKNRATLKMKRAVEQVNRLLVPSPENEDELKKRQLMELALLNGTYRGFSSNNNNIINANNNNNNGVGIFMMTTAPPFCTSGLAGGILPPGVLAQTSAGPLTTVPIFISTDPSGAPIFLAGPPPMFGGPVPCSGTMSSLPSPGMPPPPLVSPALCKGQMSLALPGPPPPSQGYVYRQIEPGSANGQGSATSPMFEFPVAGDVFHHQPPPPNGMTSYVH